MEEKQTSEKKYAEAAFDDSRQETRGYRRPGKNRKKKKLLGLLSLCLSLLTVVVLFAFGTYCIANFAGGVLPPSILGTAKTVVILCGVLSVISLFLGAVTLFLPRQKKAAAILAIVLSVLLLLACGAAAYAYNYIFGTVDEDREFQNVGHSDLSVVEVQDDGEIQRETQSLQNTISQEEIESQMQGKELEYEFIRDEDLPDNVKEIIYGDEPESPSYLLDGHERITTFVLYGTDKRGASDTIILLTIDRVHRKVKMISIARDSYVVVPQWGSYSKLSYAHVADGPRSAIASLNYNFFLNVTDYVTVNMDQLEHIVDLVGGVEIELDEAEVEYLARYGGNFDVGKCLLNGEMAVHYARIRTIGGKVNEITRTGRQRKVLLSIMSSVRKMELMEYPGFIRSCLDMCTTSMAVEELMGLVLEVVQRDYTVESHALLEKVNYVGLRLGKGQHFYCVYDLNRASDMIYRIIYEDLYISGYSEEVDVVAVEG